MIDLRKGDCIDLLSTIPDNSIDMVLCDPPYGTTVCKWDKVIDFGLMWDHLRRVVKPEGAIVMTAIQPFTSKLVCSAIDIHKYNLVWQKSRIQHFAQAPYRFLTEHEDICVFSYGGTSKNAKVRMKYNPQGLQDCDNLCKNPGARSLRPSTKPQADYRQTKTGYPKSILKFKSVSKPEHPTQKPVELMEYLVKSYTNKGDTVLDFTMGSGTTGVACVNTNRNFIGFEIDDKFFDIAKRRIQGVKQ